MKSFYIKLFSVILIFCLGGIVYSNTFYSSFHLDDTAFVTNNPAIRNIQDLSSIWKYYPCRFVTFLSIAVNYHFHQFDVFGYHLFNLAVHIGSAILAWWLALLTLSTPAMKKDKITQQADLIALLVGLVFVSHPIQIEAVTYIWQRSASMAALFYLASLCFYVKSRSINVTDPLNCYFDKSVRHLYYIGALITAVLAMFTKEIAVTLPLMILLYEFTFLKGREKLNWRHLFPFLLALFIIPVVTVLTNSEKVQYIRGSIGVPEGISPMQYVLTQFRVFVTYIRLVFLPLNQNLDYDYPISKSIFELSTLFSFLFLISIILYAKYLFSKYKLISFSILWFFLTLIPESIPFPIKDVIFEHRLYLPLVGYSLFLVSVVYYLLRKKALGWVVMVLLMIIASNSFLTYQRNKVWKDDFTLLDDTIRKSSHKARPYEVRGNAYENQGNFMRALSDYNKAVEISPDYTFAHLSRGIMYMKLGRLPQAISDYDKAIELSPDSGVYYNNRGVIYFKEGDFIKAMSDYNKAIELDPHLPGAYYNRGVIYNRQGNFVQAMMDYNKALEINPNYEEAHYNRGLVYAQKGNFTQAMVDFTKAIEENPKDAEVYVNRGIIYAQRGSFAQAISDFTKALEINPRQADAYYNRAVFNYQLKGYDSAWSDVHQAEVLGYHCSPGFISALKASSGRTQ